MNMITELIEEIRECSKILKKVYDANDQVALVLDKAADMIELLEKEKANQNYVLSVVDKYMAESEET